MRTVREEDLINNLRIAMRAALENAKGLSNLSTEYLAAENYAIQAIASAEAYYSRRSREGRTE